MANGKRGKARQDPLALARVLQEKAVTDAGILDEFQVEEGQNRHPAFALDVDRR